MSNRRPPATRVGAIGLGLVALVGVVAALVWQRVDAPVWLGDIWLRIAAVPLPYVVVACSLKALEVVLNTVAWATVLRAAYPEQAFSFRLVLAVIQGSIGFLAVVPPKIGGVALLGFYRVAFPGLTIAGLASTRMVQGIAAGVVGTLIVVLFLLTNPDVVARIDLVERVTAFVAGQPLLVLLLVVAGVGLAVLAGRAGRTRLGEVGAQLATGGAIFRSPGRYALLVVAPSVLAIVCRWGVTGTLLAAFGIPVTLQTMFLVNLSHGLARSVQIAPGGFGPTQAFDLLALRGFAPIEVVTAYSLAQGAILLAFNVAFGLAAMVWAFGWTRTRALVRFRPRPASVPGEAAA